ncbi:DUF6586 family protein [Endozoicomonadaceae bacterium StTr2]
MSGLTNDYKKLTDMHLLSAGQLLEQLQGTDVSLMQQMSIRHAALQLLGLAYRSLLAETLQSYQLVPGQLPDSALQAEQQLHGYHSSELKELAIQETLPDSMPGRLVRAQSTIVRPEETQAEEVRAPALIAVAKPVVRHSVTDLLELLMWLRDYKGTLRERLVEW